jgi:hypothetical protein
MDPEITKNHAAVSATSMQFLDYAMGKENCLQRLHLLDNSLPLILRNYEYPLHSWPWFVSPSMKLELEECVCSIPALIYKAIGLEFGNDARRIAEFYGMPELLAEFYLQIEPDVGELMQRTDAVLTDSGIKIVEINAGSTIGGWQIQWMDHLYRGHPQLQPFFNGLECTSRNIPLGYMTHIVRSAKPLLRPGLDELAVLLVVDDEFLAVEGPEAMQHIFEAALQSCGVAGSAYFTTDYSALEYLADGVYFKGRRLHAVVSAETERRTGALPKALYRAHIAGQIFWPDNPFRFAIGDKRSLSVLYGRKGDAAFSRRERELIEKYLPWSVTISPQQVAFEGERQDLRDLLVGQRERFVIKVATGFQGKNVYVGKHQSNEAWLAIVDRAMQEGSWLAQEYCQSLPFYGQAGTSGYGVYDVVWGIFNFGHDYGGCWLRLMARGEGDGVINSAMGAQETIVYEVAA